VSTTPLLGRRLLSHAPATFRVTPGAEARRPALRREDIPNVLFAGDHAATGMPSTMESACVAGQNAARAILAERGVTPSVPALAPPRQAVAPSAESAGAYSAR